MHIKLPLILSSPESDPILYTGTSPPIWADLGFEKGCKIQNPLSAPGELCGVKSPHTCVLSLASPPPPHKRACCRAELTKPRPRRATAGD